MQTTLPPNQTVRQLAQLAVLIQAAATELTSYEVFFGKENVDYIRQGAGKMVWVVGEALGTASGSETGPGECLSRDQRHDLRNHVAVVKGFSDLILMDLPWGHSARPELDDLSAKCTKFVHLLDEHRTAFPGAKALAS